MVQTIGGISAPPSTDLVLLALPHHAANCHELNLRGLCQDGGAPTSRSHMSAGVLSVSCGKFCGIWNILGMLNVVEAFV